MNLFLEDAEQFVLSTKHAIDNIGREGRLDKVDMAASVGGQLLGEDGWRRLPLFGKGLAGEADQSAVGGHGDEVMGGGIFVRQGVSRGPY